MFPIPCMRPIMALAPLAGYTTPAFRHMCTVQGADLVYSEMVSARGLLEGSERTLEYLERHPGEQGLVFQIFGDDPGVMAEAAVRVCATGRADGLDINFGCPVKKVARSGAGAVLMRHPERARAILRAVVKVSSVPVSCKFRLGWSPSEPAARAFAAMAADEGCSHVIVHGRWATQGYAGVADHEAVGRAVAGIPLTVLTNGDVRSLDSARSALALSGAQGVALGRGVLGRPDLFAELRQALAEATWPLPPPDSQARRAAVALALLREAREDDERRTPGRSLAHVRLRSHLMFLVSGFPGAAVMRSRVLACPDPETLEGVLTEMAGLSGP